MGHVLSKGLNVITLTPGQIIDELQQLQGKPAKEGAQSLAILAAHAPQTLGAQPEISDEEWLRLSGPTRSIALLATLALLVGVTQ
jgi:hypothetical protein